MTSDIVHNKISRKTVYSLFLAAFILLVFALILWLQHSIDAYIVLLHNSVFQNPSARNIFQLISRYGMGFISLTIGIYAFITLKYEELELARPFFLFILFTFAFTSIFADILKEIISRPRPGVAMAGQIVNLLPAKSPSFPSGHTVKSMALALPFAIMISGKNAKTRVVKISVVLAASMVAYSRIALQRHYLSDVLAGIAFPLIFIPLVCWIANRFYEKMKIDHDFLKIMVKRLAIIFCLLAIPLCVI